MRFGLSALLVASCAQETVATSSQGTVGLELVRNITNVSHAGYAFLSDKLPGKLLLNRFGAAPIFGKSQVSLVDLASGSHIDVASNIDWPNVATVVDESVFGFSAAIIGAGFLVPSHTTGGIWVVELSAQPKNLTQGPVKITKDLKSWRPDSGWFYHEGVLRDMNGDGLLDIVTTRCAYSVEPFNPKAGKLIWLEHPKTGALDGTPWVEHFIADGPDFIFSVAPTTFSGADNLGVCSSEFISGKLTYTQGNEKTGYKTVVVDDTIGHGFGCTFVDLNADGKMDLLATNHLNQNGSVFAYTWDGDLVTSSVSKHTLATGYSAVTNGAGTASPGDAIPFFAKTTGNDGKKPLILVSADNGNYIEILVPNSADANDMTYSKQATTYIGADVGRIAIGDTDGDGVNELFVPAYDAGQIVQYKLTTGTDAPATIGYTPIQGIVV
jgi:hypothetical protein